MSDPRRHTEYDNMRPSPPPLSNASSETSIKTAVVRNFVHKCKVEIVSVQLSHPTSSGLSLFITLVVTGTGPFTATVSFPRGMELRTCDNLEKINDDTRRDPRGSLRASAAPGEIDGFVTVKKGTGLGSILVPITWNGKLGRDWAAALMTTTGPIELYVSSQIHLEFKRSKFLSPMNMCFHKPLKLDGLGGLGGANLWSSVLQLRDVKVEPFKSLATGIHLSGRLEIVNPSKIFYLNLGRIETRLERADARGLPFGTATIESLELPPNSTRTIVLSIEIAYSTLCRISKDALISVVSGLQDMRGLELVILGNHETPPADYPSQDTDDSSLAGEHAKIDWLTVLLNENPLFISLPNSLNLVNGAVFDLSWR